MSQISPLSLSLRTEPLQPRSQPSPLKQEPDTLSAERTQALARQLDEQLANRLFAIREQVQPSNPPHMGQALDIKA